MADQPIGRVALLSIHPRHANAILDGRKSVELRRVPVSDDTTHVIVYATAPIGAIVGWFEVAGVDLAAPSRIWNDHRTACGITRREFRSYFEGARTAAAIRVRRSHRLAEPLSLDTLPGVKRPPQSFQYLASEVAMRVIAVSADQYSAA